MPVAGPPGLEGLPNCSQAILQYGTASILARPADALGRFFPRNNRPNTANRAGGRVLRSKSGSGPRLEFFQNGSQCSIGIPLPVLPLQFASFQSPGYRQAQSHIHWCPFVSRRPHALMQTLIQDSARSKPLPIFVVNLPYAPAYGRAESGYLSCRPFACRPSRTFPRTKTCHRPVSGLA